MRQAATYLGIDVGTSSLKLLLVTADGTVVARESASYPTATPEPGAAEQDPRDWWSALVETTGQLDETQRASIAAIGLVGQVPTLVPVDAALEPVRAALTWQDGRASGQARRLAEEFGDATELYGTQVPWSPGHLPARLRWLHDTEPGTVRRTRWVLQPKDYVGARLTGVVATDAWSSKGLCDTSGRPVARVLEACGWSAETCPPARSPWEVLGAITPEAAKATGLPAGIPVAAGWSDALGGILATGAMETPSAFVLSGTSDIVGVSAPEARLDPRLYLADRSVAPLALSFGPTQSSGASVSWLCGLLGIDVHEAMGLASGARGGPVFVPYLAGERTPLWRNDVAAVLLGIRAEHGHAELVAGVLSGVAYSARHVLEAARSTTDLDPAEVHIAGRGSDHPVWIGLRSRSLGRQLLIHREQSLSALGAAMLGALAAGVPLRGLSALRRQPLVVEADAAAAARGNDEFERYLRASAVSQEWSLA